MISYIIEIIKSYHTELLELAGLWWVKNSSMLDKASFVFVSD